MTSHAAHGATRARRAGFMLGILDEDASSIFVLSDRPASRTDIDQSLHWQLQLGTPRGRYAIVRALDAPDRLASLAPGLVVVDDSTSPRNGAALPVRRGSRTEIAFVEQLEQIWPRPAS